MINKAIGASGVVSQQCKTVVDQYGQTILDLLLSEVSVLNIGLANKICDKSYAVQIILAYHSSPLRLADPTEENLLADWSVYF